MTDWLSVVYHAIWILGAAIILATCSYADWQAAQQGLKLRTMLNEAVYQQWILSGIGLISLSLFLIADIWWQQIAWGLFIGIFGLQIWFLKK